MDARNTRSRKAIETLSQAINEPPLKDVHAMLLSVIQSLASIENDLLKRVTAIEECVENAHYRVSELEHPLSSLQCQFKEMQTTRKDENIIQEYRWKEYNVLFHGWPQKGRIENHDQTEAVVRKFLIEELRVPPTQVDAIKFSNAHRLPRRISAVNSESANNSDNEERTSDNQKYSPIVVKLASMKDKHSLLKLAPDGRKMKVNITRHIPMAMQVQRKTLMKTASRLYNQGKKISGKWLAVNIAFMPTMNGWFLNVISTTCCINEFLCFRRLFSKLQFRLFF